MKMDNNVIQFPSVAQSCETCGWEQVCITRNLDNGQNDADPTRLKRNGTLKRGTPIYHQGDKLDDLYFLRSGSIKSYVDSRSGTEQIVAFHLPGDLIGIDAIPTEHHQSAAVALETSAVCRLSYQRIRQTARRHVEIWDQTMRAAAVQNMEHQNHSLILAQKSARARLATFLLYLSNRFASRGCSRTEFNLSMARQDIANYLAVAVETLSRLFSEFQKTDLIEVDRRFIRILSIEQLKGMASESAALDASVV